MAESQWQRAKNSSRWQRLNGRGRLEDGRGRERRAVREMMRDGSDSRGWQRKAD